MLILIVNIILSILLFKFYIKIKQGLEKSIMFDVSYLYLLKFTVFPLIFFIVNSIFFFIFFREWILLSFIPLIVPLSRYLKMLISILSGKKEYDFLERMVIPIVTKEFNKKDIPIDPSNISIRLLDKVNKQKELDIVISVNNANRLIKMMEELIQDELKLALEPNGYIVKVIIKLPYKKKNNSHLNNCLI